MRTLDKRALHDALLQSRQYTKTSIDDLSDAQWDVPKLETINPVLWELGHVGWFAEYWCLRWRGPQHEPLPSRLDHADALYDSSLVAHAVRWNLPLPSRARTWLYTDGVLRDVLEALERADESDEALYWFRLALYHEDMHAEAFCYMRQTLAYPRPAARDPRTFELAPADGEVALAGGESEQGAPPNTPGFVFDNEQWGHAVRIPPFAIARAPVTQGEFAAFVDDDGYRRPELWDAEGRAWLDASGAKHPVYWRPSVNGGGWLARDFDAWRPLAHQAPMRHVNAFEAEAYCRWAGRRLPTEAEWEFAATQGFIEWSASVWEWTASPFRPYPGFAPGPYREYSAPWFGTHRCVRGGSFVTPARLAHPKFRNFYEPRRNDFFVGFRTARSQ